MRENLKKLFVIDYDSLDDSHVTCILKIYALVGSAVHIIFTILFLLYGYYTFALLEFIYMLILSSSLLLYNKMSVNWISIQVVGSTALVVMIYVLFLNWNFGYHLYILLLTPIMVYLKYKRKVVRRTLEMLMGAFYIMFFIYSIYFGNLVINSPVSMIILFGTINTLKVFYSLYLYMYVTKMNTDSFINKLNADKDILDKDSKIDHLTGLYNRRSMEKFLNTLVDQYRITNKTFGMVLLDIDFFKKVNDTYGHLAGDKVLAEISRLVVYTLRKSDSVFRYGGEEFLAIIPGVQNKTEALEIANAIREDVEKLNIDIDGKDINVTISCGVTLYDGLDMAENIQRVDDALYKSKNNGRNRAEFL